MSKYDLHDSTVGGRVGPPLFWMRTPEPGNAGDLVTPWLYHRDQGDIPSPAPFAEFSIMGAGSIIHLAGRGTRVWGSGVIAPHRQFRGGLDPRRIEIRMVRGPRTLRWLQHNGANVEGYDAPFVDPGYLVPRFMGQGPVAYERNYCIIPHYVDLKRVQKVFSTDEHLLVLDPVCGMGGMDEFLHDIRTSETVVSSSLHGVIFALAFGCRAIWARWSNNVIGGDWKFNDTAEAIGLHGIPCVDLRYADDDPDLWMAAIKQVDPVEEDYLWKKYDWEAVLDAAWELRPWK